MRDLQWAITIYERSTEMSGRVKYLIEKEENKKLESLISMKLGLLSSIAVILSLVLDAISLFININNMFLFIF